MRLTVLLACAVVSYVSLNAYAQAPAPTYDAGALMRQTEQNIRYQQQQNSQNRLSFPPAAELDAQTAITVEKFRFVGQHLFSNSQLQALAAPFVGRLLHKDDVQQLLDTVVAAYQKAGGQAMVYVPRQALSGPELTIQLIEGRLPSK